MASFYLTPLEGGYEVPIKEGKVSVGRGPFLRITDRRVSRHHAIIEVSGSTMRVLPIHTNPIFYKGSGATKFEALEKDKPKELQNGDCIAFLQNDLVFKVLDKDKSSIVIGKDDEEMTKSIHVIGKDEETTMNSHVIGNDEEMTKSSHVIGKDDEEMTKSSHVIDSEEVENENGGNLCEETKELVVVPLNKTRNLPSWMTNGKDKTPGKTSRKGCQRKSKKDNTCTETSKMVTSVDEKKKDNDKLGDFDDPLTKDVIDKLTGKKEYSDTEDCDDPIEKDINKLTGKKEDSGREDCDDKVEKDIEKDIENSDVEEEQKVPESTITGLTEEQKKRKREDSEEIGSSTEQVAKREKTLPCCPYGNQCYRKNPVHFQEYSHEEQSLQSQSEAKSPSEDDRLECPYGTSCYRRNPAHQREYKHTAPLPKTRKRRAKTKTGSRSVADDDDTADDSEYDDSFIDDNSEGSSCEPSEHDGSDWQPDDDNNDDDEDVGELLAEARGFTKNKKMLKPS